LLSGHSAKRKFYSHHLYAGLALPVDTSQKTNAAKFVIVQFSFAEQPDLVAKVQNILLYYGIVDVFKF
jgi:hypothetical protein